MRFSLKSLFKWKEADVQKAELTIVSDTELRVRRAFNAPVQAVWAAWTTPELVKRWYGLRSLRMTECTIDLKIGGAWRWVLAAADGQLIAFSGIFQAINAPHSLTRTELFEAMPGSDYVVTLDFEAIDGQTVLTSRMVYQSQEHRDGHLQSGMEGGMNETYERLDAVLSDKAWAAGGPA